ncbi:aspartyl/glutamyl-tRNA (Asn/Gln) amidotransferase subunit B [Wolffia australiana]
MGNKPAKEEKEEIMVRVMPPLDKAFVKWLAQDLERIHGFKVKNQPPIRPPDHYIEYMRLQGWLDVDLDDPEIARLVNSPKV